MSVRVLPKVRHGRLELEREAASIEEAYQQGLFGSGMAFDEFCHRILRPNPELRLHRNQSYTGLFDTENNYYVCGISRFSRIPRFTIIKRDKAQDKKITYTDEHGNVTSRQIVNKDEEKGKVLARSWIATFNILRGQGYEVDDEDIDY